MCVRTHIGVKLSVCRSSEGSMEVVNVCREKGKKFSSPCVCEYESTFGEFFVLEAATYEV